MQIKAIAPVAFLVSSAAALQVTQPDKDSAWDLSKDNTIEWTSVSTDPSSFDIYVVNMHVNPSVNEKVATGVSSSDGKYTLKSLAVTPGDDYQVNLIATDKNSGILAQSPQFDVTKSGGETTSASLVSTTSTSSSTATDSTTSSSTDASTSSGFTTKTSSSSTASATASGATSSGSATKTSASGSAANASSTSSGAASASSSAGAASQIQTASGAVGAILMGLTALFL